MKILKPWGYELMFGNGKDYIGKKIVIEKHKRTSLHYHEHKHETILVLDGMLNVETRIKKEKFKIYFEDEFVDIPPKTIHRLYADGYSKVVLLEVSTYFPDDVVRLKDDYDRA